MSLHFPVPRYFAAWRRGGITSRPSSFRFWVLRRNRRHLRRRFHYCRSRAHHLCLNPNFHHELRRRYPLENFSAWDAALRQIPLPAGFRISFSSGVPGARRFWFLVAVSCFAGSLVCEFGELETFKFTNKKRENCGRGINFCKKFSLKGIFALKTCRLAKESEASAPQKARGCLRIFYANAARRGS